MNDKETKVLAIAECDDFIDPNDIPENGIVDYKFVLIQDLTYDELEMLFEQSPDFVMEKRPDFIKQYHPEVLH